MPTCRAVGQEPLASGGFVEGGEVIDLAEQFEWCHGVLCEPVELRITVCTKGASIIITLQNDLEYILCE